MNEMVEEENEVTKIVRREQTWEENIQEFF